jgi:hypothetical protein
MSFPLVRRAGRPTLSGSDLIALGLERTCLDPIAVLAPDGELALGEDADPILREALGRTTEQAENSTPPASDNALR